MLLHLTVTSLLEQTVHIFSVKFCQQAKHDDVVKLSWILDAALTVFDELRLLCLSDARFFHLYHHLDILVDILVEVAFAFFLSQAGIAKYLRRLAV